MDTTTLKNKIIRDVAELPDRTSSNEWPGMMLVSAQELGDIVDAALKQQPRHEGGAEARTAEVPETGITVTDDMVTRFLGWRLPAGVHPDGTYPSTGDDWLSGTNLLTADQAKVMLEHVLAVAPRHDGAEDARDAARWRYAVGHNLVISPSWWALTESKLSLGEKFDAAIASERSGT